MSKFTEMSLAEQDKSKTVKFSKNEKSGVVVCRLFDRWYGRTFIGVARCHDTDVFDEKKGRAIAFNRARQKELISDLRILTEDRKCLTRWYEDRMKQLDKNEGLKHIYLAGVEQELNELMGIEHNYTDAEETNEQAQENVVDLGKIKDDITSIKLKQFAKINIKK